MSTSEPLLPPCSDDEERPPWERSPLDEDEELWACFTTYRDTPPKERTLRAAAERHQIYYPDVQRAAQEGLWRERARAWDEHYDRELCRLRIVDQRRYEERHRDICCAALEGIAISVNQWLGELRRPGAVRSVKIVELARLADVMMRHERLLHGDPTEGVQIDLQVLTTDELRTLRALQEKASK